MRARDLEIRRLDTRQSQLSLKLMNFFFQEVRKYSVD